MPPNVPEFSLLSSMELAHCHPDQIDDNDVAEDPGNLGPMATTGAKWFVDKPAIFKSSKVVRQKMSFYK
jgi:hypothetical protein